MIAVVDYGVGNVRSVERALAHAGAYPQLTADPDELTGLHDRNGFSFHSSLPPYGLSAAAGLGIRPYLCQYIGTL